MTKDNLVSKPIIFDSKFLNVIFFVCSLMVIGIHSYNITDTTANTFTSFIEVFLCHGIFIGAVPIFFFLSGHLFFRNISTQHDILKKIKSRTKSVLMPFLIWSGIYLAIFSLGSLASFFSNNDVSFAPLDILKGIVFYRYCFPLWYMFQLFIFVLITPIINIILKRRYLSLVLLSLLTVFSIVVTNSIDVEIFPNDERSLFQFNFFCYYFAGCLSVKFSNEILKLKKFMEKNQRPVAFISLFFILIFAFLQSSIFDERMPFFYNRFFVPFVFISLLIFFWCIYDKTPYIKNVSTMVVYGVHSIIGTLLTNLFSSILNILPTILSYFIMFISVAVISFLFAYVLKRFFKPIHFLLSGGR